MLPVFAAALVLSLGIGTVWARNDRIPAVRILGSGSHLSLLVSIPTARLLIATGSDATAFGNALGRARSPIGRRLDVLVLTGSDADLPVVAWARANLDARSTWVVDGPLANRLAELDLSPDSVIRDQVRIRLGVDVVVTVSPATRADGDWRAEIRYGDSLIVAGTREALSTPNSGAPSLAVIVDSGADGADGVADATAVIGPTRKLLDGMQASADAAGAPRYAAVVAPGDVVKVGLDPNRIVLPGWVRTFAPAVPPAQAESAAFRREAVAANSAATAPRNSGSASAA